MNEESNGELYRRPLTIKIPNSTRFSVKGKIINQKYTPCGLNPVQYQYEKHSEISKCKILNEQSKDTRECVEPNTVCRNFRCKPGDAKYTGSNKELEASS
ncbi:hypothetical protein AVEN_67814-1 [Araneus ventricosus]|uniref:Uncharacterized protein n=1 Tax=Araneus ventricosus TaxID=182803 RepID=A0A4Y2R5A3_ARAVE|nr:hypothetical protein AVEN_75047-1 [Araneus ventricosus]GBN70891.1 hypothetical protein AVEN_154186-1 [Araneus ventricosus]GBN81275.1 hypothetical protein AVEN_66692-1 [Araneus ventricosus]GBN81308.1 hypothetical protein AVEN_67814-1 [Araneus ventricosus]